MTMSLWRATRRRPMPKVNEIVYKQFKIANFIIFEKEWKDGDDPLGLGPDPYSPNLYSYLQLPQMDYTRSEPIDIDAARSPGNRASALTSGLRMQDYSAGGFTLQSNAIDDYRDDLFGDGRDSMNGQGFYGARPIMMHERRRRESNNVDGFSNGMNLAPVSVGSWIRDDLGMAMTGTSPMASNTAQLSASHQSSSYLPRQETSYMRNFTCCDTVHASLHDLLKHREEVHPGQISQNITPNFSFGNNGAISQQALAPFTSAPVSFSGTPQSSLRTPSHGDPARSRSHQLATIMDDDGLDMEMDDVQPFESGTPGGSQNQADQMASVSGAAMPNYGALMGNPTVSSVNTPTLSQQAINQQLAGPPFDMNNFGGIDMFGNGMDNVGLFSPGFQSDMTNLTIHDPASQLSTANAQSPFSMPLDADVMAALQHQAVPTATLLYPQQEEKKYKCPVIGCDKSYKNQNGLKYHKTHGHSNQKLIANKDGTFSILDPETSQPYPGSAGMEKEKPYKCDTCQKRYKNLNGLKYHRAHNNPCNPELLKNLPPVVLGNVVNIQQLQNRANPDYMTMTPSGF